jgi:hypothetical protein
LEIPRWPNVIIYVLRSEKNVVVKVEKVRRKLEIGHFQSDRTISKVYTQKISGCPKK